MEALNEVPDWLMTTIVALVLAVLAYLNKERLGLGMVQTAARDAEERTIEMQERQIEMLQEEVGILRRRVEHLENVVADYQMQMRLLRERDDDIG